MGVAAKRGTHTSGVSTGGREGGALSDPHIGKVRRDDLAPNKVTNATALGGGYYIVHTGTRPRRTESLHGKASKTRNEAVPTIDTAELRDLLEQLRTHMAPAEATRIEEARNAPAATGVPGARPRGGKPPSDSFMAEMARAEMHAREAQILEGLLLPSSAICERMKITRAALSKAAAAGRMFSVQGPSGMQLYPAFYADSMSNRRMQYRVSQALGQLSGAIKWHFFTTPKHSLAGRTPLVAIKEGDIEAVMRAAEGYKEREGDR